MQKQTLGALVVSHKKAIRETMQSSRNCLAKGWYNSLEMTLESAYNMISKASNRMSESTDSHEIEVITKVLQEWADELDRFKQSPDAWRYRNMIFEIGQKHNELWEFDDGDRKDAGYLDMVGDCGIRAIVVATDADYHFLWKYFAACGKDPATGVSMPDLIDYLQNRGWTLEHIFIKGRRVLDFVKDGKDAIVIGHELGTAHAVAIKDNQIRDTWNCLGLQVSQVFYPPEK